MYFKLEYCQNKFILDGDIVIDNVELKDISKYTNLNEIVIVGDCMNYLKFIPDVKELKFIGSDLDDECFTFFSKFKKLERLSLINNKRITGERIFELNSSNINYIDLTGTNFAKNGILVIMQMEGICFCLDNTLITYSDLIKLSYNDKIKVISTYFPELLADFRSLQITNNLKSVDDGSCFVEAKNFLLSFFNQMNIWNEIVKEKGFSKFCESYIKDIFEYYVDGLSHEIYSSTGKEFEIYLSGEIIGVDKKDDFIRIYVQSSVNKKCFKRFSLIKKDNFKIFNVEQLKCGWKQISI